MKTVLASALIALTFATSSIAFADDNRENAELKSSFQSAVYPIVNTMKLNININKAKESKVAIRLIDEAGQTLTVLKLGQDNESSNIRFDLNNLEDGIYKVEISDGIRTEVKTVKVQTATPVAEPVREVSLN
ncbi:T9SS type A sorting domain-containing protein [Larkinella rosea]|uniref:T9SS C-terminal target domain-containing protein n=1 Tax=Larkinella rosea TaxID=2025312 RepID=A0A3P1BP57_9BACT|nr:T9SS type A sorting domain-containing protein [Larkinella rosea]RRB02693.1 T9SS C-terminal target domain-containing protein [Larkinella rosea]